MKVITLPSWCIMFSRKRLEEANGWGEGGLWGPSGRAGTTFYAGQKTNDVVTDVSDGGVKRDFRRGCIERNLSPVR